MAINVEYIITSNAFALARIIHEASGANSSSAAQNLHAADRGEREAPLRAFLGTVSDDNVDLRCEEIGPVAGKAEARGVNPSRQAAARALPPHFINGSPARRLGIGFLLGSLTGRFRRSYLFRGLHIE